MIIPTPKKPKQTPQIESLNGGLVCDRNDSFWYVVLHRNRPGLSWHQWLSLQVNVGAIRLRLLLQLSILLDSADKLLSRSGQGDVFDTEVDSLLDVSVLDLLVDDDTDCALCDVVNDSGLAMINLVRHTLLNSTVCLDINDVSNPGQCQLRSIGHPGRGAFALTCIVSSR